MSLRIIKRNPAGEDKEVLLEIDPVGSAPAGIETYSVKGKITNFTGIGQENKQVVAYDRALDDSEVQIGNLSISSVTGEYLIYYTTDEITGGKLFADLLVKVFDEGANIASAEPLVCSAVFVSALPAEVINLNISTEEFIGESEYSILLGLIEPELVGITDISTMSLQGINILAAKLDLPPTIIADFLKARDTQTTRFSSIPEITEEVLYGLFRFDLPYEYADLLGISDLLKTEAIEAATDSNIIDQTIASNIPAILLAFKQAAIADALLDEDSLGPSLLAQLLAIPNLSNQKQLDFYGYYLDNNEDDNFWDKIITDGILTSQERDDVKFVFSLSVITQNHLPLIQNIWDDANINVLEDLGSLNSLDWLTKINTESAGVPNVDPPYPGNEDVDYAESLVTNVEKIFPSRLLSKAIDVDPDFQAIKLLIDTNNFDIKDDSPRQALDASYSDQQKEEVFLSRRLYQVLGRNNKLPLIKNFSDNNIKSATKIASFGRRKFIKKQTATFGDAKEAERVYKRAVKRTAAALMLHANFNPALNNLDTFVNPKSPLPKKREDIPVDKPELEVFFGSLDYCDCQHCRSSFSPAAYLVDLLSFLKEAENDINPSQTAWDILKIRRPDLAKIDLSCDNTNTVMPYVDLVNEVLELAVNPSGNIDRQTTLEPDSLRVMPEHLDRSVYDTLSNEVYPWILPFNLWNEEAKAYLAQLDIGRNEIVRASQGGVGQITEISIEEACTLLNISSAMQTVLLSTSFTSYYGGANASTLQPVLELLNRISVSYQELLALIDTDFINPTNIQITFSPVSSCELSDATLAFTSGEYADMHRFYRLTKILNWSIQDLDVALAALGTSNISDTILKELAGFKKLSKRFRLDIDELMTWFAPISTRAYGEGESFYQRIFLSPSYNTDSTVRQSFSDLIAPSLTPIEIVTATGELNPNNGSVVMAGLRISSQDLLLLVNTEIADGTSVSAEDLGHLYRVASFSRALKISVQDYLDLKLLTGLQPLTEVISGIAAPDDTLAFLTWFDIINSARLKIDELNYVFRNDLLAFQDSTEERLATTTGLIRNKLVGILGEKGISNTRTSEDLLNLFLVFMNEETAVNSLEIVVDGNTPNASQFIADNWTSLVADFEDDIATIQNKLVDGGAGVLITDPILRIDYAFRVFHPELVTNLLLTSEVGTLISDDFDYPLTNVNLLLSELTNPANVSEKIIELFVEHDFVYSTNQIDNTTYPNHLTSLLTIQKFLLVVDKLAIETEKISFIIQNGSSIGWYDLSSFPLPTDTNPSWDFSEFIRLIQAFDLERNFATASFSIVDLIGLGVAGAPVSEIQQTLSDGTEWDIKDVEFLTTAVDYTNEAWLVRLESIFSILDRVNVSAEQLISWSGRDVTYEQAQSIRATIKSKFSEASWNKVGAEVRDKLRILQRDALSAYLVANNSNFSNTDDLYSYYLVDTEVASCSLTSRIKLATSTVQLWVQRIRMDLESGIRFADEELDEWNWRKNYRVWEAARKVFLYPENFLEPELRDDKSSFFADLEDELLQDDVNSETAERAYLNYLKKLDEVGNLEISATYKEVDQDVLHVFARTKNSPSIYFYRKLEDGINWTDWGKVELDIEGDHLVPVVFNRRLMLFWPIFTEKPDTLTNDDLQVQTANGQITKDVEKKIAPTKVEVQLAFSEWNNNKWQPKKISKQTVVSTYGFIPQFYFFKTRVKSDGLYVDTFYRDRSDRNSNHVGGFFLNNCTGELEKVLNQTVQIPSTFSISNTYRNFMQLKEEAGTKIFEITEELRLNKALLLTTQASLRTNKTRILGNTISQFKITYPVTENEILSDEPFFYQDGDRIFMVVPSSRTFEKNITIELPPLLLRKIIVKPKKDPIPDRPKPIERKKTIKSPIKEFVDLGPQIIDPDGGRTVGGGFTVGFKDVRKQDLNKRRFVFF